MGDATGGQQLTAGKATDGVASSVAECQQQAADGPMDAAECRQEEAGQPGDVAVTDAAPGEAAVAGAAAAQCAQPIASDCAAAPAAAAIATEGQQSVASGAGAADDGSCVMAAHDSSTSCRPPSAPAQLDSQSGTVNRRDSRSKTAAADAAPEAPAATCLAPETTSAAEPEPPAGLTAEASPGGPAAARPAVALLDGCEQATLAQPKQGRELPLEAHEPAESAENGQVAVGAPIAAPGDSTAASARPLDAVATATFQHGVSVGGEIIASLSPPDLRAAPGPAVAAAAEDTPASSEVAASGTPEGSGGTAGHGSGRQGQERGPERAAQAAGPGGANAGQDADEAAEGAGAGGAVEGSGSCEATEMTDSGDAVTGRGPDGRAPDGAIQSSGSMGAADGAAPDAAAARGDPDELTPDAASGSGDVAEESDPDDPAVPSGSDGTADGSGGLGGSAFSRNPNSRGPESVEPAAGTRESIRPQDGTGGGGPSSAREPYGANAGKPEAAPAPAGAPRGPQEPSEDGVPGQQTSEDAANSEVESESEATMPGAQLAAEADADPAAEPRESQTGCDAGRGPECPRSGTGAEFGQENRNGGEQEDDAGNGAAAASTPTQASPRALPDAVRGPEVPAAPAAAAARAAPGKVACSGRAVAASKPIPAASSTAAIHLSAGAQPAVGTTATVAAPAPPQARGTRGLPKAGSSASAHSAPGRSIFPAPAAPQGHAAHAASPVADGQVAARRASASVAGAPAAGPDGHGKAQKGTARSLGPADPHRSPPHDTQPPSKARSYAQLHSARGIEGAGSAGGAAAAAATAAPPLLPAAEAAARITGQVEVADPSAAADGAAARRGVEGEEADRGSPTGVATAAAGLMPHRRALWAGDEDEEPDLIAQVEAEALQLGLEIYARDGGGGGRGFAVQGPGRSEEGAGQAEEEAEESLEAIMAMGRRPSEIAELLLGGAAALASGCGGADDTEFRRRRKQERKERKRALRREQKRQQRQRRRALMGLDPNADEGDGEGDGSGNESSSSVSSSSTSSSLVNLSAGTSNRDAREGRSGGCGSADGGGGEIRTADSGRAMLLLSAAGPATGSAGLLDDDGVGDEGVAAAADDDDGARDLQEDSLAGQGRILTSAGAAAALGLLFAPSPPPPLRDTSLLPRDGGAGGGGKISASCRTDTRDASGFVPSYLLDTPPPEPRASDGMTCQPRPGSDYAPSLAPTTATSERSSTLPRTADGPTDGGAGVGELFTASHSGGGCRGKGPAPAAVTRHGGGGGGMDEVEDEQFLVARDERSRKIAEQLAALQEESRQLQQQSALLQERTREISRSVGLPTPPQFTAAVPKPLRADGPPPDAASSAPAAAAGLNLPVQRLPSPAAAAASPPLPPPAGGALSPFPPAESRSGSGAGSLDAASLRRQPAPISWALPNRNGPQAPAARAFPSPPKGARRAPLPLPPGGPELQRTGSSSSLTDSLLPRWAEQVESPAVTPLGARHPKAIPLPPVQARPHGGSGGAAAAGEARPDPVGGGGSDAVAGKPPQPLLQHVPRGRMPGGLAPPAAGRGPAGAKSRLGPAAAAPSSGAQRSYLHPHPQAAAKHKLYPPPQKQPYTHPGQLQPPGLPGVAELYEMAAQQQHHLMPGLPAQLLPVQQHQQNPYQPVLPPEWAAAAAPRGMQLPPPPLPMFMPMAPNGGGGDGLGGVLPLLQGLGPADPAPAAAPTAAAKRAANNSKGLARLAKPPKGPSPVNGGSSPGAGVGAGASHGGSNGQLAMPMSMQMPPPPPWLQVPGQGMPGDSSGQLMPAGMVPVVPPAAYGGVLEPVGPWMAVQPGLLAPPAAAGGPAGGGSPNGAGGGSQHAAAGTCSFKERSASPGHAHNRNAAAVKNGPKQAADRSPKAVPAAVLESQSYLGPVPYSLPGPIPNMGVMGPSGIVGFNGAPGGYVMSFMPSIGGDGNGPVSGGFAYPAGNGAAPLGRQEVALPPVKQQGGKGTMSRSAPPGSYSGAGPGGQAIPPMPGSSGEAAGDGAAAAAFGGFGMGAPMVAWPPAPAMGGAPMYGMAPGAPFMYGPGGLAAAVPTGESAAESPCPDAATVMAERANLIQRQQMEHYREVESNVVSRIDRQQAQLQQQPIPGGRGRDRRRNSHDGRPVFRLF